MSGFGLKVIFLEHDRAYQDHSGYAVYQFSLNLFVLDFFLLKGLTT